MRTLLAILTVLAAMTTSTHAQPLDSYQWKNRPLLVFAGDRQDEDFVRQTGWLRNVTSELHERDMMVALVFGSRDTPEMIVGEAPDGVGNDALRSYYDVAMTGFAVILIGKDGTEKNRWAEPVDPNEIFAEIDAMPMRRREMGQGE